MASVLLSRRLFLRDAGSCLATSVHNKVLGVMLDLLRVLKVSELPEHILQTAVHRMVLRKVPEFLQLLRLALPYHLRELFQEPSLVLETDG